MMRSVLPLVTKLPNVGLVAAELAMLLAAMVVASLFLSPLNSMYHTLCWFGESHRGYTRDLMGQGRNW